MKRILIWIYVENNEYIDFYQIYCRTWFWKSKRNEISKIIEKFINEELKQGYCITKIQVL